MNMRNILHFHTLDSDADQIYQIERNITDTMLVFCIAIYLLSEDLHRERDTRDI